MFGEKIKVFAQQKYDSVKNLAALMEVSPQQLSSYTKEARKPGYDILRQLYLLGCDINWLLDDNKTIALSPKAGQIISDSDFHSSDENNETLSKDDIRRLKAFLSGEDYAKTSRRKRA